MAIVLDVVMENVGVTIPGVTLTAVNAKLHKIQI